jgi:lipoprotein NlpI
VSLYEEAAQAFSRAMELEPNNAQPRLLRGVAYELAGCNERALADYDRIAATGGPVQAYAMLAKYILLRQNGQEQAVAEAMASLAPAAGDEVWTDRLFSLFTHRLSAKELLAAAATDDERAEAYYYIGRQALLDGRPDDAKEAFAKCVILDRGNILETDFARVLLKQLEKRPLSSEGAP